MSEVRLTKAKTFELDPKKKYLIQVKNHVLDEKERQELSKRLEELMGKNFVIVSLPKDSHLKITEASRKKKDKK